MMMTHPDDDMLDAVFAEARRAQPDPAASLTARVLADAAAMQPAPRAAQAAPAPGLWQRALASIGGWPALGGLTAAMVAGVWVGFAPPPAVDDLTAQFIGDEVALDFYSFDLAFDAGVASDG